MRVGVLGGTFDPVHQGHLALAQAAREHLELDEVVFMPAARNPLKGGRPVVSDHDRQAMLELAIRGHEGLAYSDMEINRGGKSYAVDTMEELRLVMPQDEFWFIMGADAIRTITDWKNPEKLAKLCRFAVALRPPARPETIFRGAVPWVVENTDLIPFAPVEISSSDIRERYERRRPVNDLLPPTVEAYIDQRRLYRLPLE